MLTSVLLWVHVMGNLLWIGSITAVAVALGSEPSGRSALAIYRRLANPGFIASFLGGVALLASNPKLYFVQTHWMHAKLPIALAVIALHHMVGAHAKRVAAGEREGPGRTAVLGAVLAACAAVAAFLGLAKPF